MWRSESTCVPMWSPITIRQCAVSQSTPNFAAPTRSANSRQVSYITSAGRTTRGKLTISLWTGMLKSINFGMKLFANPAAVDVNRLAGQIACLVRREECRHAADLLRLARASEGNLRQDAGQ